jgi:hypothetical protein
MAILGFSGGKLPKAGGGLIGLLLGFIPDSLYVNHGSIYNSLASQYRRGDLSGTATNSSVAHLDLDFAYSSLMPEAGSIKYYEIKVITNGINTSNDFYFNVEGVEGGNTITILTAQSGDFTDTTEVSFDQGDYIINQVDRKEDATGGLLSSFALIGLTYDA